MVRVRVWLPPPHGKLHALKVVQGEVAQCTGQAPK
jgi:hypothetical protein